jgi:hypothetical protein
VRELSIETFETAWADASIACTCGSSALGGRTSRGGAWDIAQSRRWLWALLYDDDTPFSDVLFECFYDPVPGLHDLALVDVAVVYSKLVESYRNPPLFLSAHFLSPLNVLGKKRPCHNPHTGR